MIQIMGEFIIDLRSISRVSKGLNNELLKYKILPKAIIGY